MLRLENVRTEDMREVVRIATELYEQDQGQIEAAQQRQGLVDAAAELDLPAEYLERAAATLHARRVAAIRERRRFRNTAFAVVGLLAGVWGGWRLTHPPPPPPAVYNFNTDPVRQWGLDKNQETKATLTFAREAGRDGVAEIDVERFAARPSDGTYFVNVDTRDVPATLAGYRNVSFLARGEGLPHVRLYLEAGPTERWRSPEVPLTPDWQQHVLALRQFEHQTRGSSTETWRRAASRAPRSIDKISFKVGYFVNDMDARGTLRVDDLRFE